MTVLRRAVFNIAGTLCVLLGLLGVLLPGLPTTPFLLLAGWCFVRGNPAFGEKLLSWKVFRPYRPFLEGTKPIPPRVRWVTLGFVWIFVGASAWVLHAQGKLQWWLAAILLAAAVIGTVVILRFRRFDQPVPAVEDRLDG